MRMNDDTIISILFTIALSIGIALLVYFLIIHNIVDVDKQFSRENNLLNFYDQRHEEDIFIIGSSLVLEGIDANVVQDLLQKRQINRSVYNLGMGGDGPLDRLCEIDNIIASRPKMVVIGLSYASLGNNTDIFEDRMLLCYQRKQIHEREKFINNFQYLFNDQQLELTSQTSFDRFFYQRKFLYSYFTSFFGKLVGEYFGDKSTKENIPRMEYSREANFKDPWILTSNLTEAQKIKVMGKNKNSNWISKDLNPQKEALLYIINNLQQNNINIIIINMPLSPLESENLNQTSRKNLSDFLNSTGVQWYDYEQIYNSDYFIDLKHMNVAGRSDFSPKVATIVVDNLIKGV